MFLGSPTLVQRAWRSKYLCSIASSWWSTIMMTAKLFEKTGSVIFNLQARKSQKRKNVKISSKKSCQKNLHYRSAKQAG
jgi:hypothetical protein